MNEENRYSYRYSQREEAEIQKIREKYEQKSESKLERLRRLDREATRRARMLAFMHGICFALCLGLGMSMVISFGDALFLPGLLIGILGLFGVSSAYFLYTFLLKRFRTRVAPEILRLSEELSRL